MRARRVKPVRSKLLFPNLNIDCFTGLQRFADLNSQERVRLTQAEKCVRFLPSNWCETSVLEFPAKIMRPVAVVSEIDSQLRRHFRQIEIARAHHFQNRGANKLQKRDER